MLIEPVERTGGAVNDHDGELGQGLKMAATAVVSAVLVATLVITAGDALLDRRAQTEASASSGTVIRTGG